MKLFIGLGNPGRSYSKNRHNVGLNCAKYFARMQGIVINRKSGMARIGSKEINGHEILIAILKTFMNQSGMVVKRLVEQYSIRLADLIIIHDDLDLPLGKIRFSLGSGPGGHRGVASIINELTSREFVRIRIGIGRPNNIAHDADIIKYVLSNFTTKEIKIINDTIDQVNTSIQYLLTSGLAAAMNTYN